METFHSVYRLSFASIIRIHIHICRLIRYCYGKRMYYSNGQTLDGGREA